MKKLFIILTLFTFISSFVQATDDVQCTQFRDFTKELPGTTCLSSQGSQFKRVEIDGVKATLEVKSGILVFDEINKLTATTKAKDALKKCEQKNQMVPSDIEFEVLYRAGIIEVLGEIIKGKTLLSSDSIRGRFYHGYNGDAHPYTVDDPRYYYYGAIIYIAGHENSHYICIQHTNELVKHYMQLSK